MEAGGFSSSIVISATTSAALRDVLIFSGRSSLSSIDFAHSSTPDIEDWVIDDEIYRTCKYHVHYISGCSDYGLGTYIFTGPALQRCLDPVAAVDPPILCNTR